MKITATDVFPVPVKAPEPPFVWRKGLPGSAGEGHAAVLLLRTDEGCDGVAFAPRYASSVILPDVVDRLVRDVLLGEDPFQRELLWHKIWELDRVEECPCTSWGWWTPLYGTSPDDGRTSQRGNYSAGSGPRSRRTRRRRPSAASRNTWR